MKLPCKLRELRTEKGLTQEDAARLLAITRRQYIKYEAGDLIPPHSKMKILNKLFKANLYEFI